MVGFIKHRPTWGNVLQQGVNMIILAFSDKTSKILPRIICRHFRHVAVIDVQKNTLVLYQFIRHRHIEIIRLKWRDLKILKQHGWKFVLVARPLPCNIMTHRARTCVAFAKYAIGMHEVRVQTPDGLYKKLKNPPDGGFSCYLD